MSTHVPSSLPSLAVRTAQVVRFVVLASALLSVIAAEAVAQGWDPEIEGSSSYDRRLAVGGNLGLPLVAGATVGYRFTERYGAQVGFALLPDFTAFSGEARLNILSYRMERPVPFLSAGFAQYYLKNGDEKTSPLAFVASIGVDYTFVNYFEWGARFGYMRAVGSSTNPDVDRYGINDDVERATFSMSARYLF